MTMLLSRVVSLQILTYKITLEGNNDAKESGAVTT